jgi:arginine decarboxylase
METRYRDLIQQTFDFPQEGFNVVDDELNFNDIPLMDVIKQYGTPLKISYLPKISSQIQKAKKIFNVAMAKADYKGKYTYCYCTKSSHFQFVLEEVLKNDIHLETSSAFDVPLIRSLYDTGKISKDTYIINNGYKRPNYLKYISELVNDGFVNTIPILDNTNELPLLEKLCKNKFKMGIRVATDEEPKFEFYTSRLGIRQADISDFYNKSIKNSTKCELKMLHFFINTGIKDTTYYWTELTKCINVYCDLKKVCPTLDSLDIGGGFPIRTSLSFSYDYEYMADEIIQKIKNICEEREVAEPHIFTEFGSFTVGESGAALYSVVDIKKQNDNELWYMIDSSFITTLPDTWGIKQKFILLAVNHWDKEYQRVNLGGLTCDSEDYYNAESHLNQVYMPIITEKQEEPLYLGFFHTGAYQESLGGYGGIQHCLIPAPKHVIIDVDDDGKMSTYLFAKEQSYKSMLKTLGY